MRIPARLAFASLFAGALPAAALAHTKWFAHEPLAPYATSEPASLYFATWSIVALAVVGIGAFFERRRILTLSFLEPRGPHAFERAAGVFAMISGAFLLIAATHGYLFSPNLDSDHWVAGSLLIAEMAVGLCFLTGILERVAALGLALLWGIVWLAISPVSALENAWVLSTAAFIFIMGDDYFRLPVGKRGLIGMSYGSWLRRFEPYALPVLRIGTGATLLVLGFSEKILHPEYGINFLDQYGWNFMHALGLPYSDYLFTLSAGAVEALFGLVFLLGIVTRLNALVLAIFFSIPLFILGPIELVGHMPHFAAVALLLLFGPGERLKLPLRR